MAARPAAVKQSELTSCLKAARVAGWDQVSVTVETADGRRLQVVAGNAPDATGNNPTPLEKWKANRAS